MGTTSTGRRVRRRLRALPLTQPPADALDADLVVQVAAAALAEHPGAAVARVEVDGDGLFTAHLLTVLGQQVVVPVDRDLTVMGWVALAR